MTASNFDCALEIVLQNEGGYTNHPTDSGGPTNLGVTQRTLSDWLGQAASIAQVQALTAITVAPIYKGKYWNLIGGDEVASGVDLLAFDSAVNCGPGTVARWLQTIVGVTVDGVVGPDTVAALNAEQASDVIGQLSLRRGAHYKSLPTFAMFGVGWMSRLGRVTQLAQQWAVSPPIQG